MELPNAISGSSRNQRLKTAMIRCAIFVLLLIPSFAFADFTGRVIGVADGDTITVLHNGRGEKIRLYGIDCTEKRQAFGTKAKQFTSEQAFGKDVTIIEHGKDKYGRTLGDVILPDGKSLNEELVYNGLAWWYRKYSKSPRLAAFEMEARLAHRGLWADKDPVPPWEWRHMKREAVR